MQQSSHFTNHLPLEIVTDILLRLPILDIARFKCVCKAWLELFESPEFSKLHLSKSSAALLVHQQFMGSPASLKIFGFENKLEVDRHELNYVPITEYGLTEFRSQKIAGSVGGFLCLRVVGHIDNLYVCNPFTREYITLPTLENYVYFPSIVTYGFGVSTIGGQFKVVRIFHESELDQTGGCVRIPKSDCHVYTLGTTGTWRSIAPSPPLHYNCYSIGAFLNGNLHWLAGDLKDSYLISCLDLDKEMFLTFSAPPLPGYRSCLGSLVVLGDCLSVCDNTSENDIVIWIMKDYGVGKSWTKEFVISKIPDLSGECYELVFPNKVFRNGDILMIWGDFHLFYYSNKTKTTSETDIVEMLACGAMQAILHVPSFVSLTCFGMESVNSF